MPLFVTMLKLAPAMAAGCTVVVKPAPETPLDSYMLADCLTEAGVPEAVRDQLRDEEPEVGDPIRISPPRRGKEKTGALAGILLAGVESIALNLKAITPDEVIDIDLMKGKQREEAYRAVNPMMALPALGLLWWLRAPVQRLEVLPGVRLDDD